MNILYFDGGASPNPGSMHVCIVLDNEPHFKKLDYGTNNVAEWTALCWGLMLAKNNGIKNLEIFGDSQLVVNQANGNWQIKSDDLKPFKMEYDLLHKDFDRIELSYVPRAKNLAGKNIEQQLKHKKPERTILEPVVKSSIQSKKSSSTKKQLTSEQSECLDHLRKFTSIENDKKVFTVQGLAGTGKTSILTEFANEIDMFLVAFTGKAASVLREKSGLDTSTIHKLLYVPIIDPISGKLLGFQKNTPNLTNRIIGVDESSMVNEFIAHDLLKTGAKIIAFGDPGQLRPIEGKQYFNKADFSLKQIHRQAQESPIIRQAWNVRQNGRYVSDTDDFRIVKRLYDNDLIENDMVLCYMNKTRKHINDKIRKIKGLGGSPKAGENVMCLQNNHKYGLFNGAIYTLEKDFDSSAKFSKIVLNVDGSTIEVPKVIFAKQNEERFEQIQARMGNEKFDTAFDFGYTSTVHKFQGSEAKKVILIDEFFRTGDERIQWLYTGITRASEKITIARR